MILKLRRVRPLGISGFEFILILIVLMFVDIKNIPQALVLIFGSGILVHWMLDVNTALNWKLGLSRCPPQLDSLSGIGCPTDSQ